MTEINHYVVSLMAFTALSLICSSVHTFLCYRVNCFLSLKVPYCLALIVHIPSQPSRCCYPPEAPRTAQQTHCSLGSEPMVSFHGLHASACISLFPWKLKDLKRFKRTERRPGTTISSTPSEPRNLCVCICCPRIKDAWFYNMRGPLDLLFTELIIMTELERLPSGIIYQHVK